MRARALLPERSHYALAVTRMCTGQVSCNSMGVGCCQHAGQGAQREKCWEYGDAPSGGGLGSGTHARQPVGIRMALATTEQLVSVEITLAKLWDKRYVADSIFPKLCWLFIMWPVGGGEGEGSFSKAV